MIAWLMNWNFTKIWTIKSKSTFGCLSHTRFMNRFFFFVSRLLSSFWTFKAGIEFVSLEKRKISGLWFCHYLIMKISLKIGNLIQHFCTTFQKRAESSSIHFIIVYCLSQLLFNLKSSNWSHLEKEALRFISMLVDLIIMKNKTLTFLKSHPQHFRGNGSFFSLSNDYLASI